VEAPATSGSITGGAQTRRDTIEERALDVRIGIVQTPKELEVEVGEDVDRDKLLADIETALAGDAVLWLTDRRGRRVGVPVAKVAYVEVGAPTPDRRVGFGAP
jgi:hypothetical protein